MTEEFSGADFNEDRAEKRFIKTMEPLARDIRNVQYTANAQTGRNEALKARRAATIRRMEG